MKTKRLFSFFFCCFTDAYKLFQSLIKKTYFAYIHEKNINLDTVCDQH